MTTWYSWYYLLAGSLILYSIGAFWVGGVVHGKQRSCLNHACQPPTDIWGCNIHHCVPLLALLWPLTVCAALAYQIIRPPLGWGVQMGIHTADRVHQRDIRRTHRMLESDHPVLPPGQHKELIPEHPELARRYQD